MNKLKNPVAITQRDEKITPDVAYIGQEGLYCPDCHKDFEVRISSTYRSYFQHKWNEACDPETKSSRPLYYQQSTHWGTGQVRHRTRHQPKPVANNNGCGVLVAILLIVFIAI
jgi:hypothetical protein